MTCRQRVRPSKLIPKAEEIVARKGMAILRKRERRIRDRDMVRTLADLKHREIVRQRRRALRLIVFAALFMLVATGLVAWAIWIMRP